MLVLAFWFSKMRQITSVTATSDMQSMGTAKYHSSRTNFKNVDMQISPVVEEVGSTSALQKGSAVRRESHYLCTTEEMYLPGKMRCGRIRAIRRNAIPKEMLAGFD